MNPKEYTDFTDTTAHVYEDAVDKFLLHADHEQKAEFLELCYATLGFAGEAAELANKVKKILRDGGGVISTEVADKIIHELGDSLWYAARICRILSHSLDEALQYNVQKLQSRLERGTLQGSGDNR